MNEIENYGDRMAKNGGEAEDSQVDLVAGADEGAADEAVATPAAPGISKQKKNLVLAGFGGGIVLLAGFVLMNVLGGGAAPQEQMVQYDAAPPAQAQQPVGDQNALVAVPAPGAQVAPLIGDAETPGTAPAAPAPIAGMVQAPAADPNTPIPLNQMLGSQPTAGQVAPAVPAPAGPGAPVAPTAPVAVAQMAPPAPVAPLSPPAALAPAPVAPAVMAQAAPTAAPAPVGASEAALAAEVEKLKAQVKSLESQLALATKKAAPRPAAKPAPVQVASKPVAKPAAPVAAPVESVSIRASDLKGVVSPAGAKPSSKTARSDFSIYAVTDGRVWVVGRDGERLGPLAVGSPLTDGSKITGIDVARGVVLTSAGEIH